MAISPAGVRHRWDDEEGRSRLALVVESLQQGDANWERHLVGFAGVSEVPNGRDLRCAPLAGLELPGAQLEDVDLTGANLSDSNLTGAKLKHAKLDGSSIFRTTLNHANLFDASALGAKGMKVRLNGAELTKADLSDAILAGANLSDVESWELKLIGTNLQHANLRGAKLRVADLTNANLMKSDLSGAQLTGSVMTNAKFSNAVLNAAKLDRIKFGREHDAPMDGSDTATAARHQRWLRWSFFRALERIPLFGASWSALLLLLSLISTIRTLNLGLVDQHLVVGPIPVPAQLSQALLSSLLLVIGSTIYKLRCPSVIQSFSEDEWIYQHRLARLIYRRESWKHPVMRWTAGIPTLLGGLLALYVLLARLWIVGNYLWARMSWS